MHTIDRPLEHQRSATGLDEPKCSKCPTGIGEYRFYDGERVADVCVVCLSATVLHMVLTNAWVRFRRIEETLIIATESSREERFALKESAVAERVRSGR